MQKLEPNRWVFKGTFKFKTLPLELIKADPFYEYNERFSYGITPGMMKTHPY
jgi:hypothetical protein